MQKSLWENPRNVWESYDYLEDKIHVTMVQDSYRESNGTRVSTMLWRVPKFTLAQLNTHRQHSKNVSSSRSKMFSKTVKEVRTSPYMPHVFQAQHKGMQGSELLELWKVPFVKLLWQASMWSQTFFAQMISSLGVSKQYTNRLIEPYMYADYLVTSTSYDNFIRQRDDYAAQLELQLIARRLKLMLNHHEPTILKEGEWHLPFVTPEIYDCYGLYDSIKISVARCARTSYVTPGYGTEVQSDIRLFNRLIKDYHMSPTEHIVLMYGENGGNLKGCTQLRKLIELHLDASDDDSFNDADFKRMIENIAN